MLLFYGTSRVNYYKFWIVSDLRNLYNIDIFMTKNQIFYRNYWTRLALNIRYRYALIFFICYGKGKKFINIQTKHWRCSIRVQQPAPRTVRGWRVPVLSADRAGRTWRHRHCSLACDYVRGRCACARAVDVDRCFLHPGIYLITSVDNYIIYFINDIRIKYLLLI